MLPITRQALDSFMKAGVLKIQENIRSKRVTKFGAMHASGHTEASIHYEITDNGAKMYGAGYVFALEFGRGPTQGGGSGGNGSLRANIRKWIDEKGIVPTPDAKGKTISKDSLAFLITRSIHKNGTLLFKQGGNSGILSDVVNEQEVKKLMDALFYEVETTVLSQLLKD